MKLYHYSKEPFSELKTVRYRKQLSKEEIESIIGSYKRMKVIPDD